MHRREVLKYTTILTGTALSAPLVASLISGCQPDMRVERAVGKLSFFNPDEFSLIGALADIILPKTASPSATEMGVHLTIDQMAGTVYKKNDREAYREKFRAMSGFLDGRRKRGFLKMSPAERQDRVKALELSDPTVPAKAREGYLEIKQQVIAYYLSSEQIGKEFLNYLPIPGAYEACISLESVGGKAWAL